MSGAARGIVVPLASAFPIIRWYYMRVRWFARQSVFEMTAREPLRRRLRVDPDDHRRSNRHRRRGAHADGRLSRRLQGRFRSRAWRARDSGRGRAGGDRSDQRRRDPHGLRPAGRPGPGAGAPGGARRRPAARGGRDDGQQDVRLGHEGGDGRPRPFARRLGRCRGRRRHGEHDQRALSARSRPRRLPHGPRPHHRLTCSWTGSRTPTTRAA